MGNVILGLLLIGPATLYTLNKQFEQGISLFYSASFGSIRSALTVLLDKRLVTVAESVENGRSKKTYSITDAGRAAFTEWMLAPIAGGNLETVALSKLYLLGLLPAEARSGILNDIADRIAHDERQLEQLAGMLDTMELPPEYREIFRYQRLTLDYGLMSHRAAREFFAQVM
ncbi:MAG: PadR family transcriptional regulator [Pseudolysinimonas sp.]|uniref:PadR family transcriptional regulator n=1 Tax=Pseudolysinimonas sp. TaxID=2680009 RepID=UPI003C767846